MNLKTRTLIAAQITILVVTGVVSTFAAGDVDPTFNPGAIQVVSSGANKTAIRRVIVQPDGKILIAGLFGAVHKSWANNVARLNPDGTVDQTFRAPDIRSTGVVAGSVRAMALQADGKIVIAGSFTQVGGESRPGIARLNSDGSLDTSFASATTYNLAGIVSDVEVGADNKITFGGDFTYNVPPNQKLDFARVLSDGTLDASFYPQSIITAQTQVTEILLLPGDKTLVSIGATGSPGTTMYRLNSAATPELTLTTNGIIDRFAVQPDGKVLVGGSFTTFNGFPLQAGIVRLNTNDSIDTSFTPPAFSGEVKDIELLSGGKVLLTGSMSTSSTKNLILLNADGTADNSFSYSGLSLFTFDSGVQLDGKIVVGAEAGEFSAPLNPPLVRLLPSGSLDAVQLLAGNGGRVNDLVVLPDGRILAGGLFTHIDAVRRINIARLNGDGRVDAGFTADIFTNEVLGLRSLSNGNILVSASNSFSRLDANGPVLFTIAGVSYDAVGLGDGRLLVGLNNFLRLITTSNTVDFSFDVQTDLSLKKIIIQPDGKYLVAGFFTNLDGEVRGRIGRINPNGTIDPTFNPPGGANGVINDMALQSDGKIIIAGAFTGVNFDTNYKFLARMNSNGTLDTSFNPILQGECTALRLQPDGRVLAGCGALISGTIRNTVKRFNSDGSVDPTFDLGAGTDAPVRSIELLSGNKILIGGDFRSVNGIDRLGIARLTNNLPAHPPFDYDGDGRADISVFRPSENRWYVLQSSDSTVQQAGFGSAGDIPVPADYDGDSKTDIAIFRPSNGQWWYRSSIDGSQVANQFGQAGDVPRPSDFDGDGRADLIYFRPSNSTWYRFGSSVGNVAPTQFGLAGDQPVIGDFDGDGRSDLAIFRPSSGDWWYSASASAGEFRTVHWGQNGDLPAPADFDGDGKTDFAIFRPSDGGWYIFNSSNGSFTTLQFGTNGDRPVAADYDGDGKADVAVFRPSTGIWYLYRSTAGFAGAQFGISTDTPTPGSFVP